MYFEISIDNFFVMEKLESENHFTEIELSLVLCEASSLKVEKHLSSGVKIEEKVKVFF